MASKSLVSEENDAKISKRKKKKVWKSVVKKGGKVTWCEKVWVKGGEDGEGGEGVVKCGEVWWCGEVW
jgi:hypothetical protein